MKPEDYIRFSGLDKARKVVAASANALVQCFDGTTFHVNDLKRLVESLDIITKVGGIHDAIEEHTKWMHAPELHEYRIGETVERLAQAIRDHESIYGGGDE